MPRAFKPPQSGELRFVGDLEVATGDLDPAGSGLRTYRKFARNIRFGISDWRGVEQQGANTITAVTTTYVTIRYRPGLAGMEPNQMRLMHVVDRSIFPPRVDYYDIQGVVRDRTTRVSMQLICIRRDSTGYRVGDTWVDLKINSTLLRINSTKVRINATRYLT